MAQTLFSTILPIGIVGPSFFGIGELPANTNKEFDVSVFRTHQFFKEDVLANS
jgi:hypothetical protein